MNKELFRVWFVDGHKYSVHADSAREAMILAQAKSIKNGKNFAAYAIKNEETGQAWNCFAAQLKLIREQQND